MSHFFASNNPTAIPEDRLSRRAHGIAAMAAFVALGASNAVLNRLYEASGHPVDYATGQTSFSASQIKSWYATMEAGGTLDTYVATQLFDYVFILAVFAVGALGATFLARVTGSARGRGSSLGAAALIGTGAALDAVENLISFVMLANPQGFPDWIAVPSSAFAVAKFA